MSRWFSKGILILFCATAMIVVWQSAAGASGQESPTGERAELMLLHERLNQNMKTEALLRKEIRNALSLAARPHSEYLLHQKSLGLQRNKAAITQLRQERRDIYKQVALLSGIDDASFDLMREMQDQSVKASAPYSGAPLLAFYNRSSHGPEPLQFSPFWSGAFRAITGLFFLSIFSLPLIAIYKRKRAQQAEKEKSLLFPIFTVQGRSGSRGLLRVPIYKGEMMHHPS